MATNILIGPILASELKEEVVGATLRASRTNPFCLLSLNSCWGLLSSANIKSNPWRQKQLFFRNISRLTTKLSTWSWVKNELLTFVAKDVFCKFYSRRLRKCFCDFCEKKVVEVEQEKEYFVSRPVFFIFVAFLWMFAAHWLGALRGRRAFPENGISSRTNKSSTFAEKCGAALFVIC